MTGEVVESWGRSSNLQKRSIRGNETSVQRETSSAERMISVHENLLLVLVRGWYFVWHLFLSKFKFLRELVGDTGSQEGDHELSGSETEEDTSSSPHRIRSARQRRAPADEGH
ncbi:PREDICTED: small integral membrane protein 13 [Propithecus coquereli]|uniref:small integral membrane protein 13 n=1 Tax=Propithecus coquereli TaxID=379532 RepID=UPI00063F0DF3|nr:PREDICTED: small integral membrane protein 13 [Propithecus coquereli]